MENLENWSNCSIMSSDPQLVDDGERAHSGGEPHMQVTAPPAKYTSSSSSNGVTKKQFSVPPTPHPPSPKRQSFFRSFFDAQLSGGRRSPFERGKVDFGIPYKKLISTFSSSTEDIHYSLPNGTPNSPPPFVLKFSSVRHGGHLLAVGDEDGRVTIVNTVQTHEHSPMPEGFYQIHDNSVFDLEWMKDDEQIITCSGDQSCLVTDLETKKHILRLKGHTGSIKRIASHPRDKCRFATAARDGVIKIWDTRISVNGHSAASMGASTTIDGCHIPSVSGGLQKSRKRKRPNNPFLLNKRHGVTSVVFLKHSPNILVSGGAADGRVKFWDIRKIRRKTPKCLLSISQCNGCFRPHGISCISLSTSGTSIAVSSTDHNIYIYDVNSANLRADLKEKQILRGHRNRTFYVRTTFSPDDRFLASGSSDQCLYIWKIRSPKCESKPIKLSAHEGEVNDVDWCRADFGKLATCSDDATVRMWSIDGKAALEHEEELDHQRTTHAFSSQNMPTSSSSSSNHYNDNHGSDSSSSTCSRSRSSNAKMRSRTLVEMWNSSPPSRRVYSSPPREHVLRRYGEDDDISSHRRSFHSSPVRRSRLISEFESRDG